MFLGRALPVLPLILCHRCRCRLGPQLPHPSPSPPDLRGCWRSRLQPSPSAGPSSPGPAATFCASCKCHDVPKECLGRGGEEGGKQLWFQNGVRSGNASPPAFLLLPPEWQQRALRCRRVKVHCVAWRRGKKLREASEDEFETRGSAVAAVTGMRGPRFGFRGQGTARHVRHGARPFAYS